MGILSNVQYVFVYAVTDIFCIVLMIIILSKLSYSVASEQEVRLFRRMAYCYIMFCLLELIWVLGIRDYLPLSAFSEGMIKIWATIFIPLMVYYWFWFAETRFRAKWTASTFWRVASFVPFGILLALYLSSFLTGIVFRVTPEGLVARGPLYDCSGIVDNIYGISIIIHALILLVRDRDGYRRGEYLTQIFFILTCTIGGIADMAISMTPVMPLAIALSFVFLFLTIQESQIFNDALTGLSNRRNADRLLREAIADARADKPFYLFMLDLDRFKEINDRAGHLEGDRALQTAAKAFAEAAEPYHGKAARWGGDEFMILVRGQGKDFPEQFAKQIQAALKKASETEGMAFPLHASIGYAHCDSPKMRRADIIAAADRMLYDRKNASHRS